MLVLSVKPGRYESASRQQEFLVKDMPSRCEYWKIMVFYSIALGAASFHVVDDQPQLNELQPLLLIPIGTHL